MWTSSAIAYQEISREEIVRRGKQATVLLKEGQRLRGTAFGVHSSGFFVTTSPAFEPQAAVLEVVLNPGQRNEQVLKADVVRRDKQLGFVLLRARARRATPTLALGSEDGLQELTELAAFGYPLGGGFPVRPGVGPSLNVSLRRINSLQREDDSLDRILLDEVPARGLGGGPLLDREGKVVGVLTDRDPRGFGTSNAAIPIGHLKRFLERPELDFQPPTEAGADESVTFLAKAISVLPNDEPLELELVLSSTVSRAVLGIIAFAPIAFVEEAAFGGVRHGTAIRDAAGGDA
ncbi:MAG: serine protease, partial [Isosphaeraceae bacterium]